MIFCYLIVLIIAVVGLSFTHFNDDYLSKKNTTAVNGIFVLFIFFRHFSQYISLNDDLIDNSYNLVNMYFNQLVVVPFLFYSGYGIIRCILTKDGYMKKFLVHRFLPTWIAFAVCVSFYVLTDYAVNGLLTYSTHDILLSFVSWTSIGNSNWYMFVIFALYILVYLSFRFIDKKYIYLSLSIFTLLSIGLWILLYFVQVSVWWNTMLCFTLGMWYGVFKEKIDSIMMKPKAYWIITSITFVLFVTVWKLYWIFKISRLFVVTSLLFALVVVFITMKIKLGNPILTFLGIHTFSIYMLQRIPMIVFSRYGSTNYRLLTICLSLTIILAFGFDYIRGRLGNGLKRITHRKEKESA